MGVDMGKVGEAFDRARTALDESTMGLTGEEEYKVLDRMQDYIEDLMIGLEGDEEEGDDEGDDSGDDEGDEFEGDDDEDS